VLAGGTAAAIHAGHRFSAHADHVLTDLRARFSQVLADLAVATKVAASIFDRIAESDAATTAAARTSARGPSEPWEGSRS
jgi:hypothetical protein